MSSAEFGNRLLEALADPTGDVAKVLVLECTPLMHGIAKHIPHSSAARAEVITQMYALMERYGLGSNFVTFAPDDTNDVIMLRFCYATLQNDRFPAVSSLYEVGNNTFKEVLDDASDIDPATILQLTIPLRQKAQKAFENPICTAGLYQFMNEVSFSLLFGMDIHTSHIRKTYPRIDASITFEDIPNEEIGNACRAFKEKFKAMYPPGKVTSKQPPLGQGLGELAVTKEQKNKHCILMDYL